jgi:hypothetical protein
MKVVFLDFDGVITTPASKWNISKELLRRVKRICDETDAKLVISSSWQHGHSAKEWLEEGICIRSYKGWIKKFFTDYTYDVTGRRSWEGSHSRGAEIKAWMVQHPEVENYVIIDDEDDMLDEQLFHFVGTDWVFGIQEREVTLAIDVLNNKEPRNSMTLNHVLLFRRWLKLKGFESNIDEIYENYYPFKSKQKEP